VVVAGGEGQAAGGLGGAGGEVDDLVAARGDDARGLPVGSDGEGQRGVGVDGPR